MPFRSAAATRADARGASFDTTWFTCRRIPFIPGNMAIEDMHLTLCPPQVMLSVKNAAKARLRVRGQGRIRVVSRQSPRPAGRRPTERSPSACPNRPCPLPAVTPVATEVIKTSGHAQHEQVYFQSRTSFYSTASIVHARGLVHTHKDGRHGRDCIT